MAQCRDETCVESVVRVVFVVAYGLLAILAFVLEFYLAYKILDHTFLVADYRTIILSLLSIITYGFPQSNGCYLF